MIISKGKAFWSWFMINAWPFINMFVKIGMDATVLVNMKQQSDDLM
jgi:hypothetical protein